MSADECRSNRSYERFFSSAFIRDPRFRQRVRFIIHRCSSVFIGSCLVFLGACAAPVAAVSPKDYPELGAFIESMVERHGFDRAALTRLFRRATLRPQIVAAMERPYEALPWHEYRRTFLTEARVRLGVRYWERHKDILARAEEHYGVPAELIVAIIGVETHYGAGQGRHSVLDALVTLALDYPPRADFFRRELEAFLLLTRELDLDPADVRGSYAGALGIPQFIPTSYREFAVDFDNDERRDLFNSSEDAIASVANFLSRHGWATGQPVIDAAAIKSGADGWPEPFGPEPTRTLREWLADGVFPEHDRASETTPEDRRAALIALEGETGPLYYLGYNNFYVITRYNRSQNYAMAVYQLARAIKSRYYGES